MTAAAIILLVTAAEEVANGSTGLDTATVIALITAGVGVAGVIITALKYNKESAARAVEAQSKIVQDMGTLMDKQAQALDRTEHERDELLERLAELELEAGDDG